MTQTCNDGSGCPFVQGSPGGSSVDQARDSPPALGIPPPRFAATPSALCGLSQWLRWFMQ